LIEPIYIYVKGKGWQVENCRSGIIEISDGMVRLECRMPEQGERYTYIYPYIYPYNGSPYLTIDNEPDFEYIAKEWKHVKMADFLICFSPETNPGDRRIYMVVVPLV
jgi:hypothetical protein